MTDPKQLKPSVDVGSDIVARFRYQANLTLPFCLKCALGSEILSVIPEHLEDIAIESQGGWRFIQVKSRNPERGLWKLSDLLVKDGALRSLYRTHQQIGEVSASLELLLEGATKRGDLIENLKYDSDHTYHELVEAVAKSLAINEADAALFLKRVSLLKPPPPRQNIRDTTISLIHHHNPSLTLIKVEHIYLQFMSEIERAMRAEPLGPEWPRHVMHPAQAPAEYAAKLTTKRLTRALLQKLVSDLSSPPKPLLQRITDLTTIAISVLERKLIAGGATDRIIERAKNLCANAQFSLLTLQAQSLFPKADLIEDLNLRLETYVVTKCALHGSSPNPAIAIWDSLLAEFTANASTIDLNNVVKADPMLLLGQVCELAERCIIDWGLAHAN